MSARRLSNRDYSIAWVCVIPIELAVAQAMLDEIHESPPVEPNDSNLYVFGRILSHNIVLTCLPAGQYGTSSTARTVTILKSSFLSIRFVLLVGIGGGVPSPAHDIRLGDVVVSLPSGSHGGVVQYEFGKIPQRTGYLNAPPAILRSAIATLQTNCQVSPKKIGTTVSQAYTKYPRLRNGLDYRLGQDLLFRSDYVHQGNPPCEMICDLDNLIQRPKRDSDDPEVHFGTIASGNQVMRDGVMRDRLSNELGGVLCFEMEAAGVMNSLPCLVIRGICDYADSHKNKIWQSYAAATAAATAKEILSFVSAPELNQSRVVWDFTELHNAAKQGATETAKRLLQGGADPNAKDSDGCTPIHYAASNGQIDFVRLLFHWEVDESITNSSGKTAKDLASENGHLDVLALLADPPVIVTSTLKQEKDPEQNLQGFPVMEDRCKEVCNAFDARVEFNYRGGESHASYESYRPIYDLLYSEDHDDWAEMLQKWSDETQVKTETPEHIAMRWVHLPANNILWAKDMIKRICYSDGKTELECNSILQFVNDNLYAHTESTLHACYREPSWHAEDDKISLVLPYLDMESEQYLNRNLKPQSDHVKRMHNLISQYEVTSDIHVSRTLDQSYYYVMENTRMRDHDQVVYRYTRQKDSKKKLSQGGKTESRLLMVNQFWLWKIDEHTIITSCPERWHEGAEPKIMSAILKSRPFMTPKAINWMSHVAYRCINFSEEPNKAGLSERYTRIYARAIATASDAEARYYSSFTEAITKGLVDEINIEEEIRLLQEIKDIRDELNMLSRVLGDQLDVIAKLSRWASSQGKYDHEWGIEARLLQIKRMDEDAERVEKSLNHLLDFKQKQSNIEEAKLSRRQAEETALQGKYLFVFTIVTVIFTPLSFMAALFAIQIKEFPHDDKGLNFDGIWVGKYMAAGEFTTIGSVLLITIAVLSKDCVLAFYRTHFQTKSEDSVGRQPRDDPLNEQGDKLELPNETVASRKSQNADENQEGKVRRSGQDADQITETGLSSALANSEALPDPQQPATTNVSPKNRWLKGMGIGRKSGSGASASSPRDVNGSSV